ncbi:hypothetical protein [Actinomadura rudentiformis]|uniref:Uncharacterized protein n=1 Tax=Actinomadura rudentiformis TaxID=359158 RepID=A0A6H9YK48_9ACTN|nr:hypothetical protein [Actinomadura rudentiformis]KAB2341879.1 hypothetical protein F8566_40590 [Actinomadura rudentiformis]
MTSAAHGRAVLALDDVLCDLTPQTLAAVGDRFPAWYRDQAKAAVTQIATGLKNAAEHGTVDHTADMPAADHPGWVRLSVLDSLVRWFAGTADTCLHNPHPSRPQPVASVAWKPDLVVCGTCTHLLGVPADSTADRTCDACGHIVAGLEAGEPIYPFTVVCGVLMHGAGVCASCRYWQTTPTRKDTP